MALVKVSVINCLWRGGIFFEYHIPCMQGIYHRASSKVHRGGFTHWGFRAIIILFSFVQVPPPTMVPPWTREQVTQEEYLYKVK